MMRDRFARGLFVHTLLSVAMLVPAGLQAQTQATSMTSIPAMPQRPSSDSSEPPPKPPEAVQRLLDEAEKLDAKRDYDEALKKADAALTLAGRDPVALAYSHRERATLLEKLQRVEDAITEWRETAADWQRAGNGPGRIEALGKTGQLLLLRKSGEADEALRQAIWLAQQEKRQFLGAAIQLEVVGGLIFVEGNLEWAKRLAQAAYDIERRLNSESLAAATSLDTLGNVARKQGDMKAAAQYLRRGLTIREKLAPDSLDVARSLNSLGALADEQGDLKTAGESYRRALAIRRRLAPDSLELATSLYNLGNVAEEQGELELATEQFRGALAIREKLAPDSLDVAQSLNGLGNVADDQGDLTTAADFYARSLAIRLRLAPDSQVVAASLNNLGNVAESRGDLKTAADYYRKTLVIVEKLAPDSLDVATCLNNLGLVAWDQGDLEAAGEYHRRALAIREQAAAGSLDVAESLSNLGVVAQDRGDLKVAEEYQKRALAIEETQAPDSRDEAQILNLLGIVALERGDLAAATKYTQRALAVAEKLGPGSLDVAASFSNLGDVAHDEGDLKAAADYQRRALDIEEKLARDSLSQASVLDRLAIVARESGDLIASENLARRAWRIVQRQASVVTSDEARQALGSSIQGYAGTLLSIQVERREPESAFTTLEEARAQGLARLLFERREVLNQASGDLWPRHQEALAKLQRAEENVNTAEAQPGGSPEAEEKKQTARRAYQQARDEVDQLWGEIQKRQTRAFAPALNLGDAARALGKESTFVAFAINEGEAYVVALHDGESPKVVAEKLRLGEAPGRTTVAKREAAKRIDDRTVGFWNLAHTLPDARSFSPTEGAALIAEGRELFTALFPGEIGKLVLASKRLVLSPDGSLWQLPFAALVAEVKADGSPRYLGERVSITYTPSLALYARLREEGPHLQKGQRPEVLAVGDPDFDRKVAPDPKDPDSDRRWAGLWPPGAGPERLRATRQEAEMIARLYDGRALTGDEATEVEVRKRIETADVIHLATHGSLQTALPMSSAILLTPPEKQPPIGETDNDGALQAWEIFSQLKLRAELVVLSACDTARGETVKGEGVVGLTRALEYAGARSIVATQWSVATGESTTQLMEEFHQRLRRGEAKDEALKEAMAVVRKRYPHPFYWAPFILLGDPGNPNLGKLGLRTSH